MQSIFNKYLIINSKKETSIWNTYQSSYQNCLILISLKKIGDQEPKFKVYEIQALVFKVLIDQNVKEKDALITSECLGQYIRTNKNEKDPNLSLHQAYESIEQMIISLVQDKELAEDIANAFVEAYRKENLGKLLGLYLSKKYLINKR